NAAPPPPGAEHAGKRLALLGGRLEFGHAAAVCKRQSKRDNARARLCANSVAFGFLAGHGIRTLLLRLTRATRPVGEPFRKHPTKRRRFSAAARNLGACSRGGQLGRRPMLFQIASCSRALPSASAICASGGNRSPGSCCSRRSLDRRSNT